MHRDLQPANLFVEPGDQLKICDFGIARDNTATTQRGHANSVGGTPLYAPPEWWLGRPVAVEPCADVYAAGGILYEMLTGRAPFADARSLAELMRKHLEAVPVPPRDVNPAVPVALSGLVLRLLAKEPDDRPTAAARRAGRGGLQSQDDPQGAAPRRQSGFTPTAPADHHSGTVTTGPGAGGTERRPGRVTPPDHAGPDIGPQATRSRSALAP